jgi:hypothetical protein
MLQVFLALIGVQHICAFRFTAAKVAEIQRVFAKGFRSVTSPKNANRSINEGSVFSNELGTTRSTLKQAFSSRNMSVFAW